MFVRPYAFLATYQAYYLLEKIGSDLDVFNIAGALPFSIAPGIAPAILAVASYGVLYGVAGVCAIAGAVTILPVKRV